MKAFILGLLCAVVSACNYNSGWICPAIHLRIHDAVSGQLVADARVVLSFNYGQREIEATADTITIRKLPEPGEFVTYAGGPGDEIIVTHPGYVTRRAAPDAYSHCLVFGDAAAGQSPYWSDRSLNGVRMTAMDVWLVRR